MNAATSINQQMNSVGSYLRACQPEPNVPISCASSVWAGSFVPVTVALLRVGAVAATHGRFVLRGEHLRCKFGAKHER